MVLIISTFEIRATDRVFLERLVGRCNALGHSVAIWNTQNPGLESVSYDFIRMPWRLDEEGDALPCANDLLADSQNLPLDLFTARLLGTYGQAFEKITAEQQVLRFTELTLGIFEQLDPDCVLACNGTHIHSAIPVHVARSKGIKTLFFERGMIPDTFCLDREGYGAHSEYAMRRLESLPGYQELSQHDLERESEATLLSLAKAGPRRTFDHEDPALEQAESRIGKNEDAIRIAFFGMAEPNAGFLPPLCAERKRISPFFENSIAAARCLADDDRHIVIFKPHPGGLQPSEEQIQNDRYIFSNGNPVDLIDWADIVCANGSSLEFIALAKGKPVLQLGRSLLSNKQICAEYNPDEELHPTLLNLREGSGCAVSMIHFARFLSWGMKHYYLSLEPDSKWNGSIAFQELLHVLEQRPCKGGEFTASRSKAVQSQPIRAMLKIKSKLRSILRQ